LGGWWRDAVDELVDGNLSVLSLDMVVAALFGVEEVAEKHQFGVQELCEHRDGYYYMWRMGFNH
jgi:hypothetical protein